MQPRLHTVVQHTHDLDAARSHQTIEEHMHRGRDRRLPALVAAVANVKAANPGIKLGAIER